MAMVNNKKNDENILGYTTGVFDLFHVGHIRLLNNAKSYCDELIVGVTSDELVSYKNKKAVISLDERLEIVKNIKSVDRVIVQEDMDKLSMWKKLKFDLIFVGDDWKGTDKWNNYEKEFNKVGVKIIYFPYTKGTSSTLINETLRNLRINYEK
jgi:glycerol-3-phosphate cytidylyltransferase